MGSIVSRNVAVSGIEYKASANTRNRLLKLVIEKAFFSRLEMSSVCVLRPVFVFCVLRHVRHKNNVRRHGQHGIY